ncbi:unnamed protein product [Urochloa decumbens]|uniref:ENTH domain-containing protein n=1 Tax=Urochloa decumbens TaxID=240449 RepID=A0ABC9AA88_9POAL
MIMNVLWQRLGNTGANWRHVYKALAVIEYLLANGTERAVDDIIDNNSQIAKLVSFKYVEPSGKDVGLNVRKKAENVLAAVDDREKLQQVREKAASTRDKYFGLSSTGVTYKSSAASFSSGSYSSGSRYGFTKSSKEADTSRDSYRSKESGNSSKDTNSDFRSTRRMSIGNTNNTTNYKSRKGEGDHRRNQDSSTSHLKSLSNLRSTSGGTISQKIDNQDDDDFNPRGSSTSGTANASYNHVDLFGQSLMDDLVTTASTPRALPDVGTASLPEVDLFANTDFQAANAPLESATGSRAQMASQDNVDLFAGRSSFAGSVNSDTEFSTLDGSDSFSAFSSNMDSGQNKTESDKSSDHSPLEELNFGAFTSHTESPRASDTKPMSKSPTKPDPASVSESKPDAKKGAFQVKSSIWADSLSRGLIDLNITT